MSGGSGIAGEGALSGEERGRLVVGDDVAGMRRYFALSRLPRGPRLLAGSLLVAPGQAATDLVILLALRHATGSFGPGGVAVAVCTIGFSVSTIAQGQLIDRLGIGRVLSPIAVVLVAVTVGLAVAVVVRAPPALLILLSALLGLTTPATGPAARAAWSAAARNDETRAAAFSYCSVTQDAGFVAGPAMFGVLATATTPVVSLACCGVLVAAGALAIGVGAPPPVAAHQAPPGRRTRDVLRSMAFLAAAMAALGVTLGAVDVSAPAFATQHRSPGLAGVLLASSALGGLLGGLAYGARSWRWPVIHTLLAATTATAALLLLPALASTPAAAAAGLLLAGVPMGATLTIAYLIAGDLVPQDRATTGFSFLTLTLNAGGALGYVLAAQLATHGSTTEGFLLGAISGGLAALCVLGLIHQMATNARR